ncbi:MAG: hypothetical protein OEL54_05050 [Flavobacteriaceae bacterium]|nr:hypothetical protein [Flavobacteriaceae bacterium]
MKTIFFTLVMGVLLTTSSCVVTYRHMSPPHVVMVKYRPTHYKVVKIKGKKYYHWDNNHYRKVRGGYILIRF